MPSRHTFTIPPIADLVKRYVGDGGGWADPFAGYNSPAEFTNDLNPDAPASTHMEAKDFALSLPSQIVGVLFDPPYSPRQISECYAGFGMKASIHETQNGAFYGRVRDALNPKVPPGGVAISCGWNSAGFGKIRGWRMEEILLVAHGGAHNDTIVTVERKVAHAATMDFSPERGSS